MPILELEKIEKSYGSNKALDSLSYRFEPGVYGILGANGAGKSTLMNIICCILNADAGKIVYNGKEVNGRDGNYRSILGYMPQNNMLYPNYSLKDFLMYIAAMKGILKTEAGAEVKRVIEAVNLSDVAVKKLGSFSGGMKQRAMLAQSILGNPEILVLDEPSAGLDPLERVRIRNLISRLAENKIVIVSTHIVSDIEMIAENIIILKKGIMAEQGKPDAICEKLDGRVFERVCSDEEYNSFFRNDKIVTAIKREMGQLRVRFISTEKEDGDMAVIPSLEDVYLYYFEGENLNVDTRTEKNS